MNNMADIVTPACPTPSAGHESAADLIDRAVARGELTLSPLGRKILEARRRIEQSGIPLLDEDELVRERAERRGGI